MLNATVVVSEFPAREPSERSQKMIGDRGTPVSALIDQGAVASVEPSGENASRY
jgi:hypothetical protein